MHRMHYNIAIGAIAAILLAGPIFILVLTLGEMLVEREWQGSMLVQALPIMLLASVFGALIALLPILFGGLVMGRMATIEVHCRHPLAWAAAGAAEALLMLPIFGAWSTPIAAAFVATGALCAMIVRYGTCFWSDDSV